MIDSIKRRLYVFDLKNMKYYLLGYDDVESGKRLPKFRMNILPPFSRLKSTLCKQQATSALLTACFLLITCLSYCSILKMEAVFSSDTLVNFYQTTRRHIREDSAHHDEIKSNKMLYITFHSSTTRMAMQYAI
jgi:hypothetical protein